MDTFIYSLTFSAIALLAFLLLKYFDKRLTYGFGILFAVYLGLDDLVTGLPSSSAAFSFFHGEWNWSGKIYSLVLAIAVIFGLGIKSSAIGLTLKQKRIGTSLIALFLLVLVSFSLGLVFKPSYPSVETLAFQALMPGLAEELAYRGIAPAILLGLIRENGPPQGTPWTVVLITAVMFGVWHGLGYSGGAFSFDSIHSLYTFLGGIAYCWLRFYSGSLLFPILAHSLGNTAFELTALIGA